MKVYARQIDPKYQESPIFIQGCFPDNIAVCGNRHSKRRYKNRYTGIFERVYNVLKNRELGEFITHKEELSHWYKNVTEAINDMLPRENGKKYSSKAISDLERMLIDCYFSDSMIEDLICEIITLVDDRKWLRKTIYGMAQCEWNEIFYPEDEWTDESLKAFEVQYFNNGSEWIIDECNFNPDINNPKDIDGLSCYCTSWDNDGIRQEIADAAGVEPDDVVLYEFDGYIKTPKYKEVS